MNRGRFRILARRVKNLRLKAFTFLVKRRYKRLETHLDPRVEVTNPDFVSIGPAVSIRPFTWIYAIVNDGPRTNVFQPSIEIGRGSSIGRFCYITASNRVTIEDEAFIMDSVLITDSIHGYEDISTPIIRQPLISRGPVIICSGSWIGVGARIIGTVRIGRNSVVAVNSVVTEDVPDYCMVAGAPCRIVKRYDAESGLWRRTDPLGRFTDEKDNAIGK
jgi:acetyltransferase-like isoleucine patch superfamily enzyme